MLRVMSDPTEKPKFQPNQFDPVLIADRIDRARKAADIPVKAIAEEVWPQQGENARFSWYKKTANRDSSWENWEIEKVATILNAPKGWPFLDWDYALTVQKLDEKAKT